MMNFVYILAGVFGLLLLMQVSFRLRGWLKKGKPVPEVGGKLGTQIKRGGKLVAYFYSPTCSACRTQEKNLAQVQEKFSSIIKVNVARDMDAARAFGVMGTPTTVIIEKGVIKNYFVGITPATKLLNALNLN